MLTDVQCPFAREVSKDELACQNEPEAYVLEPDNLGLHFGTSKTDNEIAANSPKLLGFLFIV